jgi:hypothetical protein
LYSWIAVFPQRPPLPIGEARRREVLNTVTLYMVESVCGETRLESENYVCHWTNHPTRGGSPVILVRWGTDHYAVPVSGLQHLETTAIRTVLANRPVKVVAALLSRVITPTETPVWHMGRIRIAWWDHPLGSSNSH